MFRRRQRSVRRARSAYRSPFLDGRKPLFELLEDRRVLAVITVDTTADNMDADGMTTLREAILEANGNGMDDVIQFAAALNGGTILIDHDMFGPLPTITDDVDITAAALSMGITIDGNDTSPVAGDGVRIFNIDDSNIGAFFDVTLNNLTLTGGDFIGDGGAVRSLENLTIIDSTITGNHANVDGGGIYARGGDLTIEDSTISDNTAGDDGGGIFTSQNEFSLTNSSVSGNSAGDFGGGIGTYDSTVTITDSTISGNDATADGGGVYAYEDILMISGSTIVRNTATGHGGGIAAVSVATTILESTIRFNNAVNGGGIFTRYGGTTITDSTVTENAATENGGGLHAYDGTRAINSSTISGNAAIDGGGIHVSYGDTNITNSTISGNTAFVNGGGIYAYIDGSSDLEIRYSTITRNTADSNDNATGSGGGMYLIGDGGTVTIANTIIAENIDNTDVAPDIDNTTASDNPTLDIDYSLLGNNEGSGVSPGDGTGNLIGIPALPIDPLLGDLMNNGGPTFTHALLVGSPAIDAGDPGFAPPPNFDQRGTPFDRVVGGQLDIGAFELAPPPAPIILGSEPTIILNDEEIDEGEVVSYLYRAHSTGKLIVRVYYDPSSPADPQLLGLQILDENNNIVANSTSPSPGVEELEIPVVSQQRYTIQVLGLEDDDAEGIEYDLEVENFPTPVPTGVVLDPASDTGMMNNDNVTADTTPTLFIQTDVFNFVDTNNNGVLDPTEIAVLTADQAAAGDMAGIAVEVTLVNTSTSTSQSFFANPLISTIPEVYVFTPSMDLAAGVYIVSARTKIFDLREDALEEPDPAMGRSNASPPLRLTLDVDAPFAGTIDLLASSDSGMYDDDNVTNKMSPALSGVGEANAKVRVFVQKTNAMGAPIGNPLLVGSGVVGSDLSDGELDGLGEWEVTVEPLVDGKYNFYAVFEDAAGNVGDPVGIAAALTNNTPVMIPATGTITSMIEFTAADFAALVGNVADMNIPVVDVNVTVNLTHTFDADLDIVLISPTGTRIDLSLNNGGAGDNYTGTIFDDAAGVSITAGIAPFTGRFRPEEALSTLFNETALGTWTLEITDDAGADSGELLNWTLELVTPLMVVIDTIAPNTPFLDLIDDTGRNDHDNVTKNNTPTVTMTTTDLNVALSQLLWTDNFKFRIYDRFENFAEILLYDSALDMAVFDIDDPNDVFTALQFITEILPEQAAPGFGLLDGVHNLKLEVEDRAGNISHDFILEIIVDTETPPVSFGLPTSAADGLMADSDTGVDVEPETFGDRITSDTTPRFWGRAEANTVVRVFYDLDADGIIDLTTDPFLGQTVALPFDGNDAFPDGYWEIESVVDLNNIPGVARDGLRRLLVTAQDVAGNPMPMEGEIADGVDELQIFIDTQGPQITGIFVTDCDDFNLLDPKPSLGFTPLVNELTIAVRDLPSRVFQDDAVNDFLYDAIVEGIAINPGNFLLVGDHVGPIAIKSITVLNEDPADYMFDGTLTSVTSTSIITDNNLVGAAEQPIVGDYILINNGAAAGQVRRIAMYDSTTGTMTLDQPLLNLPAAGDTFTVTTFAEAEIVLEFFSPLPDDRYTLTVQDALVDPAGNHLDGETVDFPIFPSGNNANGGDFVVRFTVDSRPEIGAYVAKDIDIDINGNFVWDPAAAQIGGDASNVDLSFTLPVANSNGTVGLGGFNVHDLLFAGKFRPLNGNGGENGGEVAALGEDDCIRYFDQLAAFGHSAELNAFRWIIDTNSDGVVTIGTDILTIQPTLSNFNVAAAIPVAGNFDGNEANGDEIGLYYRGQWALDLNHNFVIEPGEVVLNGNLLGQPIVGDFDGDGQDDFAVFNNNQFFFDLNQDGFSDDVLTLGFPGVLDKPVAADMDQDGIDDIGLWVPRTSGSPPRTVAEWYFWISGDPDEENRIFGTINTLDHAFTVVPFGNDIFAEFGDERALPIVGNFDPPVGASSSSSAQSNSSTQSNTSSSSSSSTAATTPAPTSSSTSSTSSSTFSTATTESAPATTSATSTNPAVETPAASTSSSSSSTSTSSTSSTTTPASTPAKTLYSTKLPVTHPTGAAAAPIQSLPEPVVEETPVAPAPEVVAAPEVPAVAENTAEPEVVDQTSTADEPPLTAPVTSNPTQTATATKVNPKLPVTGNQAAVALAQTAPSAEPPVEPAESAPVAAVTIVAEPAAVAESAGLGSASAAPPAAAPVAVTATSALPVRSLAAAASATAFEFSVAPVPTLELRVSTRPATLGKLSENVTLAVSSPVDLSVFAASSQVLTPVATAALARPLELTATAGASLLQTVRVLQFDVAPVEAAIDSLDFWADDDLLESLGRETAGSVSTSNGSVSFAWQDWDVA